MVNNITLNNDTINNNTLNNYTISDNTKNLSDLEIFSISFGVIMLFLMIIGIIIYKLRHRINGFLIGRFGISIKKYEVPKRVEIKKEKALKLCETYEYSTNPNIREESPKIVKVNNVDILKKTYVKKKTFN